MDYEKEYKEALERAKAGKPLDEVFPELKESEDERIRKLLVWQVYRNIEDETNDLAGSVYDGIKGHDPDLEESIDDWKKCLAYLEKQKEQKPLSSEETELNSIAFLEQMGYTCIPPRKEQQPAEWSEFDKGALKDAICAADRLGNDESFNKSNPNLAKAFRVAKDWLKSLPERFTLQPEQEVVDRTVFDRIADILRWCDLPIGCPIEDFKQSESEREHLLHIVQCVAHRYANSCTYCKEYSRGYQDGLSVPHWKPSEKQMNALKNARYMMSQCGDYYDTTAIIDSLITDLQKLL